MIRYRFLAQIRHKRIRYRQNAKAN